MSVAQVDAEPLLLDTAEELARWLRVDVRTIRMWGRRGTVTEHPGGLFSAIEVADYVDARALTGRPVKRATCIPSKIM